MEETTPISPRKWLTVRNFLSILVPVLVLGSSIWLVAWIADGLMLRNAKTIPKERRAVLAIRDSVPSFEQFGTELFTEPYLKAYYGRSYYFTQKGRNDQKELIIASLKRLTTKFDYVDIFLLAHTNPYLGIFRSKDIRILY